MAQTGYTLPVFAVAAAKAALLHLVKLYGWTAVRPYEVPDLANVQLDLCSDTILEPVWIPIQQVASLDPNTALAIAQSDPGDNLDITRHMSIWVWIHLDRQLEQSDTRESLILEAGEGLGRSATGEPAIYRYAQQLFEVNLKPWIPSDAAVTVKIILPEGRQLAQKTSNAAFGILDGLALLGTSGIAQPHSAAEHLEIVRQKLRASLQQSKDLVFCLGSNGQQVVQRLGIPAHRVVQIGNWIGALLVEAQLNGAKSVLLAGYHGKLVKLAGGIFNTSSHLADARLQILAATVAQLTTDIEILRNVLACETAEDARKYLDRQGLSHTCYSKLTTQISQRASAYVAKYANGSLTIGTLLFDRQGEILVRDEVADKLIEFQ